MLKRTILALSVAALSVAAVALAQENATLLLRSGETISGQLVDMGGSGFTVRVSGQERQIPTNDVAVIDFTGNPKDIDWSKVPAGQQVVLRNGQTVDGQLYDIGGTTPLRITVRTSSGERDFSSGDIGRIVLARPTDAVATTGSSSTPAAGGGIVVSSTQQWTSTGLSVRRGETLRFNTTGQIQIGSDSNDVATASGSTSGKYVAGSPLPRVLAGALIGRIGNGQPFGIGTQATIQAPATGQLFLGINDGSLTDNHGEFRVEITRSGTIRRR